jgi:hypothetical protein
MMPNPMPVELEANEQRVEAERKKLAVIQTDLGRTMKAATGAFDGRCPVAGIDCPAKERINAKAGEASKLVKELTTQENVAASAWHAARELEARQRYEASDRKAAERELDVLRRQAVEAQRVAEGAPKKRPRWKWDQPPEERLRAARSRIGNCQQSLASTRVDLERGLELEAKRADAKAKAESARLVTATRATAKIYSKAQRLVAERVMAEIELASNAALQRAQVPLELQLRWARQGGSWATTCEECGAPFPKTAKAKECTWCKAERGKALIERLDVALSDWSGAAEDLAGIAVQVSAAAWLRRRRGMRWANLCIDEPFGALDQANRRDFSQHLSSLLGQAGVAQAFVVAHDRAIMASLPLGIELVGGAKGTRIG